MNALLAGASRNLLVGCNYNETAGFSRRGPGPQSVFMNGRVHHYMKIASSTSQNCGISYFIFDDIASLAGSADAQNVDPLILSDGIRLFFSAGSLFCYLFCEVWLFLPGRTHEQII